MGRISQELLARKQSEKGMDPDREELLLGGWGDLVMNVSFLLGFPPCISMFSCDASTMVLHATPGCLKLHIAGSEKEKETRQP